MMKTDINRYGCKDCWVYKTDCFEEMCEGSFHCARCKLSQEFSPIKIGIEEFGLNLLKTIIDGITKVIIGGQAMTEAYTTVVGDDYSGWYGVFFGTRMAYVIKNPNEQFFEDMRNQKMAEASKKGLYLREENK